MSHRAAMPAGVPVCQQYIQFRMVPNSKGGTDKLPLDIHGNVIDAHDQTKWTDAATAWASPFNTRGVGWIVTPGWLVIDLDRCLLPDGSGWSALAVELCARFDGAYVDVTPSGQGLRIICRGVLPDGHRCRFDGGEVYTLRRFVTITGQGARGDAAWVASEGLCAWLVERLGLAPEVLPVLVPQDADVGCLAAGMDDDALIAAMLAQPRRSGQAQFGASVGDIWVMDVARLAAVPEWAASGRSDGLPFDHSAVDMAMGSHLAWWCGHDLERMERLFRRWPGFREWKYARARGYHMTRVMTRAMTNPGFYGQRQALAVGVAADPAAPGVPAQPGLFYAYLPKNTYYHRPTGEWWVPASVDNSVGKVAFGFDSGGTEKKIKATQYISITQPVHQLAWWPGAGEIIEGWAMIEGGWTQTPGVRVLNTYKPPVPPQPRPGDTPNRWLEHLRTIYPQHVEVILDWMAFAAQNATVKINWALVWGGNQGIGKDSMLEPLNRAVGEWNWQSVKPEQIMGEVYNDYLECRVLVIDEAKDLGGEGNRFQFYDKTKTIITAPPKFHSIRSMYAGRRKSPNLNATIITTNYRSGGLYLPADDRRHYVMFSNVTRQAFNEEYWVSFWEWMNNGGADACAAFLLARDVSGFNPKAPPIQTPEFWEMVGGGQPSEHQDIADLIEMLPHGQTFSVFQLSVMALDQRNATLAEWLQNKPNGTKINRILNDMGIIKYNNPDAPKDGRWRINSVKVTLYKRP